VDAELEVIEEAERRDQVGGEGQVEGPRHDVVGALVADDQRVVGDVQEQAEAVAEVERHHRRLGAQPAAGAGGRREALAVEAVGAGSTGRRGERRDHRRDKGEAQGARPGPRSAGLRHG
jgi:hypothetical protein